MICRRAIQWVERLVRNYICLLDPLFTHMDFDGQIFVLQQFAAFLRGLTRTQQPSFSRRQYRSTLEAIVLTDSFLFFSPAPLWIRGCGTRIGVEIPFAAMAGLACPRGRNPSNAWSLQKLNSWR
jgi:hypothetical protein